MATPEKRRGKKAYGVGTIVQGKNPGGSESKRARNTRQRLEKAAKRGARKEAELTEKKDSE